MCSEYTDSMSNVQIVGVLNTTPDSYYDGGKYTSKDIALKRIEQMIAEGVDIVEVGGESTGPGSSDVSVDEELRRTIPIVQAIRSVFPDLSVSLDTYKAPVAKAALEEGVMMINDVTAGRGDPDLLSVVANTDAHLVLMYAKDSTARTTVDAVEYEDVVATVKRFLTERMNEAEKEGIDSSRIIVDPGMGHFISSDAQYSFEVIARLSEIASLAPVCISPSRKSFLAGKENLVPSDRLPGTIAASIEAVRNGACFIRTHDIAATRRAVEITESINQHRFQPE